MNNNSELTGRAYVDRHKAEKRALIRAAAVALEGGSPAFRYERMANEDLEDDDGFLVEMDALAQQMEAAR